MWAVAFRDQLVEWAYESVILSNIPVKIAGIAYRPSAGKTMFPVKYAWMYVMSQQGNALLSSKHISFLKLWR